LVIVSGGCGIEPRSFADAPPSLTGVTDERAAEGWTHPNVPRAGGTPVQGAAVDWYEHDLKPTGTLLTDHHLLVIGLDGTAAVGTGGTRESGCVGVHVESPS
jgi:hypothetical protein